MPTTIYGRLPLWRRVLLVFAWAAAEHGQGTGSLVPSSVGGENRWYHLVVAFVAHEARASATARIPPAGRDNVTR